MRLIIERALFEAESAAEAMDLVGLLSTVARDNHHALLTDPPYFPGADNGPIDAWLASRTQFEANAFRVALGHGALIAAGSRGRASADLERPRRWNLAGPLEIRVRRLRESDWRSRELTLSDAVGLLHEPVHLVLENAWTELAFVRHLAGATNGASLRALVQKPGRILMHGGGGGDIKKWLETLTEDPPTPAIWRKILRTWVLFDNDAGDLDARELSRSAIALIDLCERVISIHGAGLSWICLRRREIESYVPDSGLRAEALAAHNDFVEHVISWRADPARMSWAWALDFKKGLRGDLRETLSQEDRKALKAGSIALEAQMLKIPFTGLSSEEIGILERGMSDRLGEALRANTDRTWTSDFPAEYDRGPVGQLPRLSFVQSLFDRM